MRSLPIVRPLPLIVLAMSLALSACGRVVQINEAPATAGPGGAATPTAAPTSQTTVCAWATNPASIPLHPPIVRQYSEPPPTCITAATPGKYSATIHTKRGDIVLALDQQAGPRSVNNFVFLAAHHFYDDILFHRVVPGFVVQAGDPQTANPHANPQAFGTGGPGYTIPDEFPATSAVYTKGCLAMAKTTEPNSTGSQFFICTADDTQLSPLYNYFGQVSAGIDVALQLQQGDAILSLTVTKSG